MTDEELDTNNRVTIQDRKKVHFCHTECQSKIGTIYYIITFSQCYDLGRLGYLFMYLSTSYVFEVKV